MDVTHDWEFWDTGREILPISVGLVRADGARYYAIFQDMPMGAFDALPWLRKHVAVHLPLKPASDGGPWDLRHPDFPNIKTRQQIQDDVRRFITDTPDPDLWAYYAAYDHVCLAQLFGRMVDMPIGVPRFTNDIKTEIRRRGDLRMPEQAADVQHHALHDAEHDMAMLRVLREGREQLPPHVAEALRGLTA